MEPAGQKYGGTDPTPKRGLTPEITLPKGGGAIRGIGEKFAANPVTGTGSMTVPIASPGRSGFGPQLSLSYDSGAGNGPFGFGWSLSLPAITRKTDKGLPHTATHEESDIFILSGAEDLVPALGRASTSDWARDVSPPRTVYGNAVRHSPLPARASRACSRASSAGSTSAIRRTPSGARSPRTTSPPGTARPRRAASPIRADPSRIFSWLICESYDDKGNVDRLPSTSRRTRPASI